MCLHNCIESLMPFALASEWGIVPCRRPSAAQRFAGNVVCPLCWVGPRRRAPRARRR